MTVSACAWSVVVHSQVASMPDNVLVLIEMIDTI